jgi:hypothetical protein
MLYWLHKARELGYTGHKDVLFPLDPAGKELITNTITELEWHVNIPPEVYGFTILTEDYVNVIEKIQKQDDTALYKHKYKADILDKLPRRVLMYHADETMMQKWEVFDTKGLMLSAFKPWEAKNVWVANLQQVMCMFSTYLWYYQKHEEKAEAYRKCYLVCHDIVEWAGHRFAADTADRDKYRPFLPSEKIYGKYNWSSRYQFNYHQFRVAIQEEPVQDRRYLPRQEHMQPGEILDLSQSKYDFDPTQSPVMQFHGKTIDQFYPKVFSI